MIKTPIGVEVESSAEKGLSHGAEPAKGAQPIMAGEVAELLVTLDGMANKRGAGAQGVIADRCRQMIRDLTAKVISQSDELRASREPAKGADARDAVQKIVADYLHDYELDDGEHCAYRPNEAEAALIMDAVQGLLADDEFAAAFRASPSKAEVTRNLNSKPPKVDAVMASATVLALDGGNRARIARQSAQAASQPSNPET